MTHRFSQRIGQVPLQSPIQVDGMNDALRNSLWNAIHVSAQVLGRQAWSLAAREVALEFTKHPIDALPPLEHQAHEWVKKRFYLLEWFEVYDFVEFWVGHIAAHFSLDRSRLIAEFNRLLQRESSGYRFLNGLITPISDPIELTAVQEATTAAASAGFGGARDHLAAALSLLAKRPEPDYRNSIKESISAVESAVNQVAGTKADGLAAALAQVERRIPLHGALKSAMKSLYGYTSDANGVRHAILEAPTVGFAEAKFMLVACAAFVSFLLAALADGTS